MCWWWCDTGLSMNHGMHGHWIMHHCTVVGTGTISFELKTFTIMIMPVSLRQLRLSMCVYCVYNCPNSSVTAKFYFSGFGYPSSFSFQTFVYTCVRLLLSSLLLLVLLCLATKLYFYKVWYWYSGSQRPESKLFHYLTCASFRAVTE